MAAALWNTLLAQPWPVTAALLAIACAVPLGVWSVSDPAERSRIRARQNFAGLFATDARQTELAKSRRARFQPFFAALATPFERIAPSSLMIGLGELIQRSDHSARWTAKRLLGIQVGAGLLGVLAGIVIIGPILGQSSVLVAGLLGTLGVLLPILWLRRAASNHQRLIRRELADTIDQLTVIVEAGLGFDAALAQVAEDRSSAIARELKRTVQNMQLGVPRTEAMDQLANRVDLDEVRDFVSSVQQATELGVPLGKMLRLHASDLRQRRRATAEEQAMKVGVKLTIPTVLLILPALLLVVLGPAVLTILDTFSATQ